MAELEKMVDRAGFQVLSKTILPAVPSPSFVERISQYRLVFSGYHLAELAIPSLAYMISLVAEKKDVVQARCSDAPKGAARRA